MAYVPIYTDKPVYVTKYALTKGILKFEPDKYRLIHDTEYGFLRVEFGFRSIGFAAKDWTFSLEEAQGRATRMREAKLTSLKRRIEKLSKVTAAKVVVMNYDPEA